MVPVSSNRHYLLLSALTALLVLAVEIIVWSSARETAFVKMLMYHVYAAMEFFVIVCAIYLWKKLSYLFRQFPPSLWFVRGMLQGATALILILALLNTIVAQIFVAHEPYLICWLGNFSLGLLVFTSTGLIPVDIVHWVWTLLCSRGHSFSSGKRVRVERVKIAFSLLVTAALVSVGLYKVSSIRNEHVVIPIKGLSPNLNGTTIVQLSDIHVGPFLGKSKLEAVVEQANLLDGDLVLITGDLVDSYVEYLADAVQVISKLKSKYGVYFCTGTVMETALLCNDLYISFNKYLRSGNFSCKKIFVQSNSAGKNFCCLRGPRKFFLVRTLRRASMHGLFMDGV